MGLQRGFLLRTGAHMGIETGITGVLGLWGPEAGCGVLGLLGAGAKAGIEAGKGVVG